MYDLTTAFDTKETISKKQERHTLIILSIQQKTLYLNGIWITKLLNLNDLTTEVIYNHDLQFSDSVITEILRPNVIVLLISSCKN